MNNTEVELCEAAAPMTDRPDWARTFEYPHEWAYEGDDKDGNAIYICENCEAVGAEQ